ncbi:MAG: indolepyruvate oxidoreductase subunit beta [Methanomicrobiales archaeon]|nr:indolepyruvate oxidoreductase subunit beta [Methanomicrobiales archaeon]
MTRTCDLLIVGVGGQGTILASNIIGEACLLEGVPVRGSETHGMAQRGGSVESHIRIGSSHGPLIAVGSADVIIAFDLLEALRYSHYLAPGGTLVANLGMVIPTSVFSQDHPVPARDEVVARLAINDPCLIEAEGIARAAGSALTQNVVMLGAASLFIPLSYESMRSAVTRLVPEKMLGANISAFEGGREAGGRCGHTARMQGAG